MPLMTVITAVKLKSRILFIVIFFFMSIINQERGDNSLVSVLPPSTKYLIDS